MSENKLVIPEKVWGEIIQFLLGQPYGAVAGLFGQIATAEIVPFVLSAEVEAS